MRHNRIVLTAAPLAVALSLGGAGSSVADVWSPPADSLIAPSPPPVHISGEVRGGQRLVRPMPGSLRFALQPITEGDRGGWEISIYAGDSSEDFVSVATPPYHGLNERVIEAWHFRHSRTPGPDSTGDDVAANAPGTDRSFRFVTNAADFEKYKGDLEKLLWPAGLSDAEVDSIQTAMDMIPTGEGLLTIRAMSLDGLSPGETPWFEKMRFDVVLRLPPALAKPPKETESLKPPDKTADKPGG